MDRAAQSGDLKMIRWLHETRSEGCTTAAMDNAALGGHFEALLLLDRFTDEGCAKKAMASHVSEIREWASDQ
ncbi:hypothetical protein PR002_g26733 [Phytophthora rubi]|uniref:Uncharacterized protein n=1 Tax=Phytophthora rubi TaxID=129364 RepID=A0A6A3HMS3_9STRA|nr:hypothetical protein PR002_g26733 [Phytophthora rubi]